MAVQRLCFLPRYITQITYYIYDERVTKMPCLFGMSFCYHKFQSEYRRWYLLHPSYLRHLRRWAIVDHSLVKMLLSSNNSLPMMNLEVQVLILSPTMAVIKLALAGIDFWSHVASWAEWCITFRAILLLSYRPQVSFKPERGLALELWVRSST